MRFSSLETLAYVLGDTSLNMTLLEEILKVNSVEHMLVTVDTSHLDEDYLDSLLEMQGWKNNTHFAIYESRKFPPPIGKVFGKIKQSIVVYKPRSLGPTTLTKSSVVIIINNLNFEQTINLCNKTLRLKAFL